MKNLDWNFKVPDEDEEPDTNPPGGTPPGE